MKSTERLFPTHIFSEKFLFENAACNSCHRCNHGDPCRVFWADRTKCQWSGFSFRGRNAFLQSLLVLQAFPAITLVIPIFLIVFWVGLLNTLYAPILVLTALELPFFIFIMKGFFDAVPWDIEMSAMTDGASRRQAFWMVVLPQVRVGMIAIGVFAFIKGWEEYVFVNGLRTGNGYWVMSTYLYYVREDVMGVDYGMVAAVAVLYVLPALILYLFAQKYLTQMTVGGVKG